MITKPQKICDGCKKPVAEKRYLRWRTIKSYITIRINDLVNITDWDGVSDVIDTIMDKHYCKDCWNAILEKAIIQED